LENVLICHPRQLPTIEDVLEYSPSYFKFWSRNQGQTSADTSTDERITIPGTTVKILDSEPVYSSILGVSNDFSEFSIKLVGIGHGIFISEHA